MSPINKTTNFSGQDFFIGLDVHKKSWFVTIRTLGMELAHFSQKPDARELFKYLTIRYPGGHFISAYEAGFCGTSHHTLLCKLGIDNRIIHPADVPQSDKEKKNKTDLHDSRSIARYLESRLLRPIYVMAVEDQQRRALYRLREAKVKDRTRQTNRLHGLLYYFGIELPERFQDKTYVCTNFLKWLGSLQLATQQGTMVLQQHINDIIYERKQVLLITKELRQAVMDHYKESYHCLLTVPGFGPVVTMAFLSEIGDLHRFDQCPDQFNAFLGLVPAEQSSGNTTYSVHIQSRCNTHLRYLLIEAAWVAIRKCPVLLAYYRKHAGKNNKRAVIKVARKLALIAKAVALNKKPYQAEYQLLKKQQGLLANTNKPCL